MLYLLFRICLGMNFTSCTVIGRIGRSPETKQAGQTTVTKFSLAVSKKRKGEEATTWFSCSVWGKRGETIAEKFKQGDGICVTGPISMRSYQKRNGSSSSELELEVNDWSFIGGTQRAERSPGTGGYTVGGNHGGILDNDEDLIPF